MPLLFVVFYVFSGWDVSETFNVYDDSIISGSWSEKKNMEWDPSKYKKLKHGNSYANSVCGHGNIIIIPGSYNRICLSLDYGTTWTSKTIDNSYDETPDGLEWNDCIYAFDKFIMYSTYSGKVAISINGIEWNLIYARLMNAKKMIFTGSKLYVLQSSNEYIRESSDGISWSDNQNLGSNTWINVFYCNNLLILLSEPEYIWDSIYKIITMDSYGNIVTKYSGTTEYNWIIYLNNMYYSIYDWSIYQSSDLSYWTEIYKNPSGSIHMMYIVNGIVFCDSGMTVYHLYSFNMINWFKITLQNTGVNANYSRKICDYNGAHLILGSMESNTDWGSCMIIQYSIPSEYNIVN